MRDSFAPTMYEVGHKTKDVFIVVADISPAGSMAPFRKDFPDRFVNVGVAEQSMIALCAGLALRGCRPFAYTIATFSIYRPFEQVRVDVCYQNLPVTIVGIGGGLAYSTLGGTHHAQEDVAIMSALPNMTVMAPCDPAETAAATWAAVACNGPVYLRLGKAGESDLTSTAVDPYVFGRIRRLRQGRDICILSYGSITKMAFDAAEAIEKESGATVAVTSVHTIKPLDREGIARLAGIFHCRRRRGALAPRRPRCSGQGDCVGVWRQVPAGDIQPQGRVHSRVRVAWIPPGTARPERQRVDERRPYPSAW